MLWCYDEALAKDLSRSIDPLSEANDIVKVVDKEGMIALVAQIKEDQVKFPLLCLTRAESAQIDVERTNFTRMHKGVAAGYDSDTNCMYYERAIPINLSYNLTVLTTNQIDMDEIMREIMFKYLSMYFLTIEVPYESKRLLRFGVAIDKDVDIQRQSGSYEYIKTGTLYQSIVPLKCQGCVLIEYTPKHVERTAFEIGCEP